MLTECRFRLVFAAPTLTPFVQFPGILKTGRTVHHCPGDSAHGGRLGKVVDGELFEPQRSSGGILTGATSSQDGRIYDIKNRAPEPIPG